MGRYGRWVLLTTLGMLGAITAEADSLRCGRYVVNTGDLQSRVLDLCGEPQRAYQDGFIEQVVRQNDGYGYYSVNPAPYYDSRQPAYQTEYRRVVPVYKWEYNFGPGTFLKILVFQGDALVGIVQGPRQ
ncbi:MAG TPA: DUF2845 domain-containing protein [Candidatus Competibacteraceae bacterium]|nr:MAG: DUF2845 domain-containing protein [Candidatus Competibacteraceae bacterium]HOB62625.1 DUF2845 domain-containing protein [Candidatus Competibacteraceae bacterium]HQA26100.1 DUF2845 domain-containing protein [Candidatus Competibacteraceae bacterium]HQD56988.1 DUF2845 domain-containing protein [Candidatus Competibacteraceae bacterium]